MENTKEEIVVPDYIKDEYDEYLQTNKSPIKWENLNALINLATLCGRFTDEQAVALKKQYK